MTMYYALSQIMHPIWYGQTTHEQPREGSSNIEESAAEIQEQSGASHGNQLIACHDLTIINICD